MAQATQGDTVKVHYTGKLDDGTVFDSSEGRDPLEFTVGSGQLIPGFDSGVTGMNVGDSKTVQIPSQEAYGPHHEEMVIEVGRDEFPPDVTPAIGDQLQMKHDTGQIIMVTVTEVGDEKVILDANHPLAGKDLIFDIQLVEMA
jgi:peptidylprolyl isomerase